ncbi:MAG TPA: twin-arginine translocation signal domain-containing protein, partial [Fimbriimonas sp.]|nr:twin-arginine translocation signal domain-containing protein [Fimbriimonas sp.]
MSNNNPLSRRDLLRASALGIGNMAFLSLLTDEAFAQQKRVDSKNPLAPKSPMFPAKAKRVIFVFLHGGPSQVDTFD